VRAGRLSKKSNEKSTSKVTLAKDFTWVGAKAAQKGNQAVRLATVTVNAFPTDKDTFVWEQYTSFASKLGNEEPMLLSLKSALHDEVMKDKFIRFVSFG